MKGLIYWLLAAGMLATGCSSKVYVQRSESANMAKYRTYSWVETRANEQDNDSRGSAFADIAVRNAVREILAQEGWREVKENPEVLLGYDILVERPASAQQVIPAEAQPFTRVYYNPFTRRWGRISYPAQFYGFDIYTEPVKEATLTLNMMDAKTDESIWQGWTTERISTARLADDVIEKSVKNILQKLEQ